MNAGAGSGKEVCTAEEAQRLRQNLPLFKFYDRYINVRNLKVLNTEVECFGASWSPI